MRRLEKRLDLSLTVLSLSVRHSRGTAEHTLAKIETRGERVEGGLLLSFMFALLAQPVGGCGNHRKILLSGKPVFTLFSMPCRTPSFTLIPRDRSCSEIPLSRRSSDILRLLSWENQWPSLYARREELKGPDHLSGLPVGK